MKRLNFAFYLLVLPAFFLTSCLNAKKMGRFVAEQYNNEKPSDNKPKEPKVTVINGRESAFTEISRSEEKTSDMLPLLFYWQWKYSNHCKLNPGIAVNNFSKAVNGPYYKLFQQKLNGQTLELKIEQVPSEFSFIDEAHLIWLIYAFGWDKVYLHPSEENLVVSYKTLLNGQVNKTGTITIRNKEANKGLRFFQSWRSLVSEYITEFNADINSMAKEFAQQLNDEL